MKVWVVGNVVPAKAALKVTTLPEIDTIVDRLGEAVDAVIASVS